MKLSTKHTNLEQALDHSQRRAQLRKMASHVRQTRRRRRDLVRRPRYFKDRSNPLEDLEEEEVFSRYRFRPETIYYILRLLPDLSAPTKRNSPLTPLLQLLTCLRFLATGSMHLLVGDSLNISRSTAGRCIRNVARKLYNLSVNFIRFPTGRRANEVKTSFTKIAGFPNVLACIDGTFIKIQRPTENKADFVSRKGYHALNVQMCCDPMYRITSCNASWPGSVHDSRIFRTSALCQQFENGQHDGLLLGDSGYPCRTFLMVPFVSPSSDAEEKFNAALGRTRVLIEQTFGVLKRRFQILHKEIITTPATAVIYIVSCVILHNIGIDQGDIIDREEETEEEENAPARRIPADVAANGDALAMRQHIVQTYFT